MKQKLQLNSNKAYLQIDFAFAVLILFSFLFISYNIYSTYADLENRNNDYLIVSAHAKDLCKILVSTPGSPNTWSDVETADSIGLKSSINESLSSIKINALSTAEYFNFTDIIGINEYVEIKIIGVTSKINYLNFGYNSSADDISAKYSCFGFYNNETVKVLIEVWK
jgi:hypothetical protein